MQVMSMQGFHTTGACGLSGWRAWLLFAQVARLCIQTALSGCRSANLRYLRNISLSAWSSWLWHQNPWKFIWQDWKMRNGWWRRIGMLCKRTSQAIPISASFCVLLSNSTFPGADMGEGGRGGSRIPGWAKGPLRQALRAQGLPVSLLAQKDNHLKASI